MCVRDAYCAVENAYIDTILAGQPESRLYKAMQLIVKVRDEIACSCDGCTQDVRDGVYDPKHLADQDTKVLVRCPRCQTLLDPHQDIIFADGLCVPCAYAADGEQPYEEPPSQDDLWEAARAAWDEANEGRDWSEFYQDEMVSHELPVGDPA